MKLYLDNCMFNRPFDDQSNFKILLETEAKLKIQENIRSGLYELVWSYILDYENNKNPFRERREQIAKWKNTPARTWKQTIAPASPRGAYFWCPTSCVHASRAHATYLHNPQGCSEYRYCITPWMPCSRVMQEQISVPVGNAI